MADGLHPPPFRYLVQATEPIRGAAEGRVVDPCDRFRPRKM